MKLDHALEVYGLRPAVDLDYPTIDELTRSAVSERLRRSTAVFARLCARWLVVGPPVLGVRSTGLSLRIRYRQSVGRTNPSVCASEFSWDWTTKTVYQYDWTCGLIEAMFRRWTSVHRPVLQQEAHGQLPGLNEWPTTTNP